MIGLFVLLGVAFAAIFGVSFAAGEAIKESHVNAEGVMTGLDGSAVKTEEVRSYATLSTTSRGSRRTSSPASTSSPLASPAKARARGRLSLRRRSR